MADDQISISAAEAIKEMRDLTKEANSFLKALRPMESALEEVANGMALTATNSRKMVTAQQATNNAIRDMTAALRNNTKERDKASESVVNLSRSVEKMVDMLVKDRSAVETLSASQDKLVASTLRLTQEVRSLGTAQVSAGKASASTSVSLRTEAQSVASLEEAYAKYRMELAKTASSNAGMGDPEAARRLREEMTRVQEAFAKSHPDVKEYEAALSRAATITQKSLSPMEALQAQLAEMRSALAAGGPEADKFRAAIQVLEGKVRDAQDAFAKSHPDVKEYEAALSRAAAITQKSLSPMEALQAQLAEMRSALAAGGPEADKFRAAIEVLEGKLRETQEAFARSHPDVKEYEAALSRAAAITQKSLSPMEALQAELARMRSALAAGGPDADKFRAAIQALEQAEARLADEMANTLPSVKAQKTALEGIRNELRKAETAQERFNLELRNLELSGLARDSKEYTQYLTLIEKRLRDATEAQYRYNGAVSIAPKQVNNLGRSMNLTAQGAAIFREGMQGAGLGIGFMSAQTIVASASAYAFGKALRATIAAGVEFEKQFTTMALAMQEAETITSGSFNEMADNVKSVRYEILSLATSTEHSLEAVTKGAEVLARSGQSSADIMQNLGKVLDLATVGSLELEDAANIATSALAAFGEGSDQLGRYVDILAVAANKSKASVEDLGLALKYTGPVAHELGLSAEELATAIGTLSNAGIRSVQAGTSIRRLLVSLLDPTDKARAVMDKYGVSLDEASIRSGKFAQELAKLNAASLEEQKALTYITALPATLALINASATGAFGTLETAIRNATGYTEEFTKALRETTSVKFDNLVDTISATLIGAFSEFGPRLNEMISEADTWVTDNSGKIAQTIGELVNGFLTLVEVVRDWSGVLTTALRVFVEFKAAQFIVGGLANGFLAARSAVITFGKEMEKVAVKQNAAQRLMAMNAAAGRTNSAFLALAATTPKLAAGVRGLTAALGGPVGALITLGSIALPMALEMFWRTRREIENLPVVLATTANSVEDLTTKFRAMNEARREQEVRGAANILEFGPAQKASYEALEKAQETELKNLRQRKAELENLIPVLEKEAKAARDRAVLLNGNRNAEGEYARTLGALRSAQRELSSTNEDGIAKARELAETQSKLADVNAALGNATALLSENQKIQGEMAGQAADKLYQQAQALDSVASKVTEQLGPWKMFIDLLAEGLRLFSQFTGIGKGLSGTSGFLQTVLAQGRAAIPSAGSAADPRASAERLLGLTDVGELTDPLDRALHLERLQKAMSGLKAAYEAGIEPGSKYAQALDAVELSANEVFLKLEMAIKGLVGTSDTMGGASKAADELTSMLTKQRGTLEQTIDSLRGIQTQMERVGSGKANAALKEMGISAEQAAESLSQMGRDNALAYISAELTKLDPRFKDFGKTVAMVGTSSLTAAQAQDKLREILTQLEAKAPGTLAFFGGMEAAMAKLGPASDQITSGLASLVQRVNTLVEEGDKMFAAMNSAQNFDEMVAALEGTTFALDKTKRASLALKLGGDELRNAIQGQLAPTEKLAQMTQLLNAAMADRSPEERAAALERLTRAMKGTQAWAENELRGMQNRVQMLGASLSAQTLYNFALEEANGSHERALELISDPAWGNFYRQVAEGTEEMQRAEDAFSAWKNFADTLADAFLRGTRGVKDHFKSMLKDLQSMLLRSAIWATIQRLFQGASSGSGWSGLFANALRSNSQGSIFSGLLGSLGGSSGGVGGSLLSGLSGAISSGVSGGLISLGGTLAGGGGMLGGLGMGLMQSGGFINSYGLLGGLGKGLTGGLSTMFGGGSALMGIGQMIPAIAAIGAVAAAIQKISGGKLFGTKYKFESAQQQFDFTGAGFDGSASMTEVRQRSLFRGRKWRTTALDIDAETKASMEEFWNAILDANSEIARQFGRDAAIDVPASFKQEMDASGKVTAEIGTILGRQYAETWEVFAKRITAENIIANIDGMLGTLVSAPIFGGGGGGGGPPGRGGDSTIVAGLGGAIPMDVQAQVGEASAIAERWRDSAEALLDGAQFLLLAATDIHTGTGLLGEGGTLTQITDLIEDLQGGGESLSATYARVAGSAALLDQALALSGVQIDGTREHIVRFAAAITDAAGGLERASALWGAYFDRFYTDAERAQFALTQAQASATNEFGDIGMNYTDFTGEGGMAEFRRLFESALPTLSAEAIVEWLEAAAALGIVIDATDALNAALGEVGTVAAQTADQLAAVNDILDGNAWELAAAGMTEAQRAVAEINRAYDDHRQQLLANAATADQLATLEAQRAQALEQAEARRVARLADLLDGITFDASLAGMTALDAELARLARQFDDYIAQATALGATEEQLATIRDAGAAAAARAEEAEAARLAQAEAQRVASLNNLLDDARFEDALAGMSDYEANLAKLNLQWSDAIARMIELGASEEELAEMRGLQANAVSRLAEAEQERLAAALESYEALVGGLRDELSAAGMSDFAITMRDIDRWTIATTASLNEAARAAGLQAAREEDLALVHQVAAQRAAAAIAALQEQAQALAEELYGTPLSRLEDRIAALQESESAASSAIGGFSDALSDAANAAAEAMGLLLGSYSPLRAVDKLPIAMDALRRGETDANTVLGIAQKVYGSGRAYNDIFYEVQRIAAQNAASANQGGGGNTVVVGEDSVSREMQALIAERDALLAEQQAAQRFMQASDLAQMVADLSTGRGEGFDVIAESLGFTLEQFAEDLRLSGVEDVEQYLRQLQEDQRGIAELFDTPTAGDLVIAEAIRDLTALMVEEAGLDDGPGATTPAPVTAPIAVQRTEQDDQLVEDTREVVLLLRELRELVARGVPAGEDAATATERVAEGVERLAVILESDGGAAEAANRRRGG